jgi:hypothetical protein
VLASARFGCEGSEQHAKIAVRVRLYRCHRDSVWCDGPLVAVAEDQKTCYHAIACIADTPKVNCASGYKFIAYARWAAYNVDGERVHTNGAWPDMNRELPHPISGIVGTTC